MTNEEIVGILNNSCGINLQKMIIKSIGMTTAKVKDDDFRKKVVEMLKHLYHEAYNDDIRKGFRIFADEILKTIGN